MRIFRKKHRKAMKIMSVLSEFKNLSQSKVLDVGCGKGIISSNIGNFSKKIIGVDIEDRRVVKIKLTEKGMEAFKLHEDFHKDLVISALQQLDSTEEELLIKVLSNIDVFFNHKYKF